MIARELAITSGLNCRIEITGHQRGVHGALCVGHDHYKATTGYAGLHVLVSIGITPVTYITVEKRRLYRLQFE